MINENISRLNCSSEEEPAIAIDSLDNIHLVWFEYKNETNQSNICYMKLDNVGNILVDAKRVSSNVSSCHSSSIAIDSRNNAFIVWSGSYSIFLKSLDNYGNTLINETILSTHRFILYSPKIITGILK